LRRVRSPALWVIPPHPRQAPLPAQPGAEPLNGDGFYRFKIGDFQATVISDGYGQIPIRPILAMNVSEAELAPVLRANFMQPVIEITNNILVVDTGHERVLADSGFGEKLGPSFGKKGRSAMLASHSGFRRSSQIALSRSRFLSRRALCCGAGTGLYPWSRTRH
jgi:hypothetical protein